ncbi:MAG: putative aminohydrolase SsnA [Elusimicrobia bacterium]|nr:putative aminohydrolase SsnA [Elusimicrobiota bacterium]
MPGRGWSSVLFWLYLHFKSYTSGGDVQKTLIIKNAVLFTGPESGKVLKNYDIFVRNGIIEDIFKSGSKKINAKKTIDANGRIVMPGFINSHMHFYSSFSTGLNRVKPSEKFIEVLENLWWRLDKKLSLKATYYSALVALINAIKNGTTTIIDHHASPFAIRGSLFEIEKAVRSCGLRASLCYEVSDRDGKKKTIEGLRENYEFIRHNRKNNDNFVKGLFGLHASFTLSDETLAIASDLGNSLDSGFHIHCAEDISDEEDCIRKYNMRIVERLNKFSILGPKTILAHCVCVNEREMDIIRINDAPVVLNPQSNANNAVGISDILKFAKNGILYGLGTDAMTNNMMEELRAALWMCHLKNKNPSAGFAEVSKLLLNNQKIALRHFDKIAEIKKGNYADIVILDYYPHTPLSSDNFYGHLIFGISQSDVTTTIVNGDVLMENRELKIGIDEKEVFEKASNIAGKIWSSF